VTADVRRTPRRGTPSAYATSSVGTGRRHGTPSHALRDASFARSFDPCVSILAMHCPGNRRWRGALEGIAAGQTWVTGRNQHRGRRSGHRAARRPSPLSQGSRRGGSEPEGGRGHRPSEETRVGGLVARTSYVQLQKSSGGVWSRISSAFAQQKLRQGRVNGDLARSERRWVKPSTGAAGETASGISGQSSGETEGVRTKTQVARERHRRPSHRPKGGVSVAGPGL
jgi:hypothetical protein